MIYKALATVNKSIKAIGKDRTNQQQGFKFRGIDDVMNELHSLFAANEIIILQTVNEVTVTERTNQRGTGIVLRPHQRHVPVHTVTDRTLTSPSTAKPWIGGDKATTKAMSIALKYALLQMFLIPTEEEKDPGRRGARSQGQAARQHETSPEFTEAMTKVETCDTTAAPQASGRPYKTFQGVKIFKDAVNEES